MMDSWVRKTKYSPLSVRLQRLLNDEKVLNDFAADEMLLDDAFERGGIARVVPGTLGVDDSDGTAPANAKAIGFGAQDAALFRQPQFLQTTLQIIPRLDAASLIAALGNGLVTTQEDVSARYHHAHCLGHGALLVEIFLFHGAFA